MDVSRRHPLFSSTSTTTSSNNNNTTTTATIISSIRAPCQYDRAQEKLIRHKLFMLSCEKLAELRCSNKSYALPRNLAILSVCKRARSDDYYPVNECKNLISAREANTRTGPLFTRRSNSTARTVTFAPTPTVAPPAPVRAAAPLVPQMMTEDSDEEDSYPSFLPRPKARQAKIAAAKAAAAAAAATAPVQQVPEKKAFNEDIVEYSIQDISHRSPTLMDFDYASDNEIEEGTDALDVFFMDEDGASMARKRKSHPLDSVAEKRHHHSEEEIVVSPKSTSLPIPIPRPVKQPDQVVLDTLVPMRGFFPLR